MKIAVFEVENWERRIFDRLAENNSLKFSGFRLTAENASAFEDSEAISPFIYSQLSRQVLEKLRRLRFIATRSTGYEHIDTDFCRERNILVSNVPLYGECTVAEHVFGLLLTITRKLGEAIDRTRKGDFSPEGLQGTDLNGKTLGVIGTGAIGRCVIRIATGFQMCILAHDLVPDGQLAAALGFTYAPLKEVLSGADVITLHVPGKAATRPLLSTEEFSLMKRGVILLNTARGNLIDIQALLHALAEGRVAGAGLDVLPEEPTIREEAELLRSVFRQKHELQTLLADHILLRMRNVIVTPHIAFNTREAIQRILDTTVENILAFLRGEPQNVIRG